MQIRKETRMTPEQKAEAIRVTLEAVVQNNLAKWRGSATTPLCPFH